MSYAMDDMGLQIPINRVQATNINQTLKTGENNQSPSVSASQNEQITEVVELSDKASKLFNKGDFLNQVQAGESLLETAGQGLSSILESLNEIKKLAKKGQESSLTDKDWENINDNIKKELENIEKTAKNTSFNDIKPLDISSDYNVDIDTEFNGKINISPNLKDASLKSLNLPEVEDSLVKNKEEADVITKKVDDSIKEIKKRQQDIETSRKELDSNIKNLSIINIEPQKFEPAVEKVENKDNNKDIPDKLKETTIKSIYEKPEISVKIHHLNGSMILALLSFSGASKP
jgi:flagellin-like hook-associated protein FlgL